MVYIAPLPKRDANKEPLDGRSHPQTGRNGGARPGKAGGGTSDKPQQQPAKSKPPARRQAGQPAQQRSGKPFALDAVQSKQDLLAQLTQQAELNTLVLQREQAALRALQESQNGPVQQRFAGELCSQQRPAGLPPPAGQPQAAGPTRPGMAAHGRNHNFHHVVPKAVDPSQVPGLGGPSLAARQQQQNPGRLSRGPAQEQQQQQQRGRQPKQAGKAVPGAQQPGKRQQQQQQQAEPVQQRSSDGGSMDCPAAAASPFADADWRYDWGPDAAAGPVRAGAATFPDSPSHFKTGVVFEVPEEPAANTSQALGQHHQAGVGGSPGSRPAAAALQQGPAGWQQQQQQGPGAAWEGAAGVGIAELREALQTAQGHPDPRLRDQLVKEIKQKLYKLELEQQIAEREGGRRAAKAAAAAREAAEAAARAAAPPPWDPAARAGRHGGGGGEPLRGADGATMADLRGAQAGQRMLMSSLEGGPSCIADQQQQQQYLAPSRLGPAPAGMLWPHLGLAQQQQQQQVAEPASLRASQQGGKGFMSCMNELRAGPSEQQRAAAASARQQLLDDLQAQVAERAARAAAAAAAEAERAALEDASLRSYYSNQHQQQLHISDPEAVQQPFQQRSFQQQPFQQQPFQEQQFQQQPFQQQQAMQLQPQQSAALLGTSTASAIAAAAAAAGGSGSHIVQGKRRRGKPVMEAPWLDQIAQKQQAQAQQQMPPPQQQQLYPGGRWQQQQPGLPQQHSLSHAGGITSQSGSPPSGAAGLTAGNREASLGSAASRDQLSSQQLAAALQDLQQEQALMWQEFTKQNQALDQLLLEKQQHDSQHGSQQAAAWQELENVKAALQRSEQALQAMYDQQQQQTLLQGGLSQQYSLVQISSSQRDLAAGPPADCLDSLFVVETQMVPISNHLLPDSPPHSGQDQLASDPGLTFLTQQSPPNLGRHTCNSGSAPDAERSCCSSTASSRHHCQQPLQQEWRPQQSTWQQQQQQQQWQGAASQAAGADELALARSRQQQQRPPASPPILRGDRLRECKPSGRAHQPAAGSGATGKSPQQQRGGRAAAARTASDSSSSSRSRKSPAIESRP